MSKFILDPELLSALPAFCLCDAEDGEKTSLLGIEKCKKKELSYYKINVDGPVASSHPSIQFDKLKSEMSFLTKNGEVWHTSRIFFNFYTLDVLKVLFL